MSFLRLVVAAAHQDWANAAVSARKSAAGAGCIRCEVATIAWATTAPTWSDSNERLAMVAVAAEEGGDYFWRQKKK